MGNTSARAITFLYTTVPIAKDLKELGTTEIHIIRKKRKILGQCFLTKLEVRKKKNYFHNDTILYAAFPLKTRKFSHISPFHPPRKQHRIFSA